MLKIFAFALLGCSTALAQTSTNPCDTPAGSPIPPGCFPVTYKPADGGPERPVLLGLKPGTVFGPTPTEKVPKGGGGAVAAAGRRYELDLGANASYAKPDYGVNGNILTGVFVTLTGKRIGGEANASYTAVARSGIHENTLVAGPRYNVLSNRRMNLYAKASFGVGHFSGNPTDPAGANAKNYFVQSYGGGLDLHVSRHLNVRAFDGEYQRWSSFPANGLSPYNFSAGVSFRL